MSTSRQPLFYIALMVLIFVAMCGLWVGITTWVGPSAPDPLRGQQTPSPSALAPAANFGSPKTSEAQTTKPQPEVAPSTHPPDTTRLVPVPAEPELSTQDLRRAKREDLLRNALRGMVAAIIADAGPYDGSTEVLMKRRMLKDQIAVLIENRQYPDRAHGQLSIERYASIQHPQFSYEGVATFKAVVLMCPEEKSEGLNILPDATIRVRFYWDDSEAQWCPSEPIARYRLPYVDTIAMTSGNWRVGSQIYERSWARLSSYLLSLLRRHDGISARTVSVTEGFGE